MVERLGAGSQGTVSLVLMYSDSDEATGLYACKFVKRSFLDEHQKRREYLDREIRSMEESSRETSTPLQERITSERGEILVMDYANGRNLNALLGERNGPLSEAEAQAIVHKLANGLADLQNKKIMHRDININNVVLHFPRLEPTPEDL